MSIDECLQFLPPPGCPDIFPRRKCTNPRIELHNPGPISCQATITGRVLCDEGFVPGIEVNLSSTASFMSFTPANPITNLFGEFTSTVTVEQGTDITEGVDYTASAVVNGVTIENTNFVRAGCVACDNPVITLDTPEATVTCDGAALSGTVTCGEDGEGITDVAVFFTPAVNNVFINPNPAITDSNGVYTATITPITGAMETINITAFTTVGGIPISDGPNSVDVDCPLPPMECTCKFRLNTQGGEQPEANIRVTRFGNVMDYTGTLNITVNQCGASAGGGCDPGIDNFNFTFNANNGDTFQFTQGRRTSITCEDNFTRATVIGHINGRINQGPARTFTATITATLNNVTNVITWEIYAEDETATTFETLTPFAAPGSPQSFIADCP
ncbi:hypothetical protein [Halobacillus sp. Marseille-Q1614]|uniref:hypothetical protein n=1 Tax=Halobacillus sp. Marseille-Q1614 TaxID=2709134 RepID=UPI00156D588E|nr:hypothetical protein [Halobacillus sp. Marseille-Q1614]